jgi:hypothetical protein
VVTERCYRRGYIVDPHADYSRLAEVVGGLVPHENLCLIYDTQEEQFAAALPYITIGLERVKNASISWTRTQLLASDARPKGGTDVGRYHPTSKPVEYESKLNRFLRDHDARVISQYHRLRFSPELILFVIRTHPLSWKELSCG